MFLLTDRYPPFSFEDMEYPVRPVLPERGPLNRVTVFFRIFVAIPAFVFYQIVQNGLTFPLLIVMWFVVLFTGSMPASLYPTYMALLRYEVRFHSWFAMITPEYAWGMLGDTVPVNTGYTPPPFVPPGGPPPPPPEAPAVPPTPPPASQPPAQPFSYPSTSSEGAATPPPGRRRSCVAAGLAVPAGSAAAATTPTAGIDVRPRGHAAAILVGADCVLG